MACLWLTLFHPRKNTFARGLCIFGPYHRGSILFDSKYPSWPYPNHFRCLSDIFRTLHLFLNLSNSCCGTRYILLAITLCVQPPRLAAIRLVMKGTAILSKGRRKPPDCCMLCIFFWRLALLLSKSLIAVFCLFNFFNWVRVSGMHPLRRFKAISYRDNMRSEEQRPKMAFRSLAVAPTRLLKRGRFLFKRRDIAVTF